jgi:hypothetical protein
MRMKTGRNDLCPCGSGKKFKKCCIDSAGPRTRPDVSTVPPPVLEMMRLHEARENVRRQQQGHGNPIISLTDHGYRLVAVGKTIYWGKDWLVFADFLLYFMKKTLRPEWGAREKSKGLHPLFRWLEKFQRHSDSLPTQGKMKTGQMMGFLACWRHLAYALYLIARNDELPKPLLRRLRDPMYFMPAYYEAVVGAALAVAGFELSCAETKAISRPTPEFRVKSKITGTTYEIEAKRKERWKSPTHDVSFPDFLRELESYVRDQVHAASKKKLKNPIYWFELSIPTLQSEADWRALSAKLEVVLRDVEKHVTVEGDPISPAFVLVTNHTFLANEDIEGEPSFMSLQTIKIDDYPCGKEMEIEAALEAYDKYRDIIWMTEAWKIARTVPVTFDGTPPELLSPDGQPQGTVQIGDTLLVPDQHGEEVAVCVEDIASMGDKASAIVHNVVANERWVVHFPLSDGEAKAAVRFTDAIFGKSNASRGLREDDLFGLYDFFLKAQEKMSQEQVDKFFHENPTVSLYKGLPLKNARARIAREYTKWMWARKAQARKGYRPTNPVGSGSGGHRHAK